MRIATFNVENLFGRAKVLDFANHQHGDEIMAQVAELQRELKKATYNKPKIAGLYDGVADYISFNVQRSNVGHLIVYRNKNGKVVVKANGAGDWVGFIQFKRSTFSDKSYFNTARVIRETKPDVLAVIEAESRPVLDAFNTDRLSSKYRYNMLVDCKSDTRGIDVGIYSMLPIGHLKSHIFDKDGTKAIFSRDCLEVEVLLGDGRSLWILVNHFKSKSGPDQAANDAKRKRQAQEVHTFLTRDYDLSKDLVVVAGDLNDTPTSDPLAPLLATNGLHDVLEVEFGADTARRWTYSYRKKNEQIDYLLVSTPLRLLLTGAGVERRGIAGLGVLSGGAEKPFTGLEKESDWRDAASDHACVWADFNL